MQMLAQQLPAAAAAGRVGEIAALAVHGVSTVYRYVSNLTKPRSMAIR
jgi:hypothetical protein